jgi:hypothetical protein
VGGAIAVAVLALLVTGALGCGQADHGSADGLALSRSELLSRAGDLSHAAYWLGPRPGTKGYELTSTPAEGIYVRYLPAGANGGDRRAYVLVVGTYPVANARRALERAQKPGPGNERIYRRGSYEVLSTDYGNHVQVAVDGQPELEVEVYSPRRGQAEELVRSGALRRLE